MLLGGGAEPEATGHVDRHGRLALTVRSARSKIDKLAACCKFRSFEYRESCTDGFNTRMLIELLGLLDVFRLSSLVRKPGADQNRGGGRTRYGTGSTGTL